MLENAVPIAFLPSSDLDRSRDFFAFTLGLPIEEVTPFACVVRTGSVMLRVTKVDGLRPQPFTVFGWEVADLAQVMATLTVAGVNFLRFDGLQQSPEGVWTTPGGDEIAWFNDPDGNTLSLTRFQR
jgi:catechol 2,3-dioxygenase-like lactoylglutathione lyase family enzyme